MLGFSPLAGIPLASTGADFAGNSVSVSVTGVSATMALGTVSVVRGTLVTLTGVYATGYTGEELVWGRILPAQTPGYTTILPTQTPGYTAILPTGTNIAA